MLAAVEDAYREYKFNEVAQSLYNFFWGDYCDWFVEAAKTDIFAEDALRKKSVLAVMDFVLSGTLRLLHPFMPHITEELWAVFGFGAETIQFQSLPKPVSVDTGDLEKVRAVYDLVRSGRNLRAESRVPSNKKANFVLRPSASIDEPEVPTISRLVNADTFTIDPKFEAEPGVPMALTPLGELFLVLATGDKSAERDRLDKEIARIEGELQTVGAKLSNASFVERAPAVVVEEHRKRKTDFTEQLSQLRQARAAMD
jgi:valyl-tRNA synthetase